VWRFSANGSDTMKQITFSGHSIRWSLSESPDGKHVLTDDKEGNLWLVDTETDKMKKILTHGAVNQAFGEYHWSENGRYVAISMMPDNADRSVIILYDLKTDHHQQVTSSKYNSYSADFSSDGKWLYFLSDRHFDVTHSSPNRDRSPDPILGPTTEIFALSLDPKAVFPYRPKNELMDLSDAKKETDKVVGKTHADDTSLDIVWKGLNQRLWQVPIPTGNYAKLRVGNNGLYFLEQGKSNDSELKALPFTHTHAHIITVSDKINHYELSQHRNTLLFSGDDPELYIVPAQRQLPEHMNHHKVNTSQWHMEINPVQEWNQMFHDAWLMHRDMFYDPNMRGVDWESIESQVKPVLARISNRYELGDLLGQMMGRLNALHSQVGMGEDTSQAIETARASCLGADLVQRKNEVQIKHIYQTDVDVPDLSGPLAKAGVDVNNDDRLIAINHQPVKSLADVSNQLRNQADQQVLLTIERGEEQHQSIVYPATIKKCRTLAYQDWSTNNQRKVAQKSDGEIGYIYLQGMMGEDFATFAREFYANLHKKGLIIDVRNNEGGYIDSWILDTLFRRAWMFKRARHGQSEVNMPQVFRGHIAVIANQMTYSDGETFASGFKALKLGPVIGKRTFGAGVWLDDQNQLTDWGEVRAAEYPQYSIKGKWIIEQHGVEPTIDVDNLPYATFHGHDAQLDKAVDYLRNEIQRFPVAPLVPSSPAGDSQQASDIAMN